MFSITNGFNIIKNYAFFLIFLFALSAYAQPINKMVHLNGTLKPVEDMQLEDMSEFKELQLEDTSKIIRVDSLGNFSLSFYLTEPNYFRIGRNILYLTPGDNIYMRIDKNYPEKSLFKGSHRLLNDYLKFTPFPHGGSFLLSGQNLKPTFNATLKSILAIASKRQQWLSLHTTLPKEFILLEKARINADIINSLNYYATYYIIAHKLPEDSALLVIADFKKIINPKIKFYSKNLIDPNYLKLAVYRNIIDIILEENTANTKEKELVNDWINAKNLFEEINETHKGDDSTKLTNKIKNIRSQNYKFSLLVLLKNRLNYNIGDDAIAFKMVNSDGDSTDLNSYHGKVIYIDLWATWCMPCIEEIPFVNKLKNLYKDNDKIAFLSLSIDSDKNKWLNYLSTNNLLDGKQYMTDPLKLNAYSITTIPRVIIITKDFKIATLFGPLPSSEETKPMIDKLLQ